MPKTLRLKTVGGADEHKTEGDVNMADNNEQNVPGGDPETGTQTTIDYDKIQKIVDNATAKKENAVLKSYFQQQGLSEEEAKQAISDFKANKQTKQNEVNADIEALQEKITSSANDLNNAKKESLGLQVELAATKEAMNLGISGKTLEYVLRMADMSKAVGEDGKVSQEAVKESINKVLEDIPQLRQNQGSGIHKLGADSGSNNAHQQNQRQVAQKRWNRFNY